MEKINSYFNIFWNIGAVIKASLFYCITCNSYNKFFLTTSEIPVSLYFFLSQLTLLDAEDGIFQIWPH